MDGLRASPPEILKLAGQVNYFTPRLLETRLMRGETQQSKAPHM